MENGLQKLRKNRLQKRAGRTRTKLKEAALDIFSEKPVDAATVGEITEKADVGKGTLYQHFEDKQEIVVTLVDEAAEHLLERIRRRDAASESLEDMLERFWNAHYGFSVEAKEEFILLCQGKLLVKLQSDIPEDLAEPYLRYLKEIENQISKYLSPGIPGLKVRALACAVAGFVFGFFSFAMIALRSDEIEKSIKFLRRAFVRQLVCLLGR